jgi:Ca2+-binding RTX toxin-like protein
MSVSNSQAQGLVLALFGASAGGHLTSLAAASNLNILAGDLTMSAGLILGKDLSSNTAFRDHITANLKLTGDALTAANAWLDGQLNAGAARGDMVATAVTFLATLTDTTSPFYASAQAFQSTVAAAVTWSTGAGATTFGVSALRANQGKVDVVAGSSFVLTTGTDTIIGTAGNDTITGDKTTFAAGTDQIIDQSKTDNDTLNITTDAAVTATTITNVEKINVDIASLTTSTLDVDASKITGAQVLTVTRSNLVVGGSTLTGGSDSSVSKVSATAIPKVVAGAGVKTFAVDQTNATATKSVAGVEVDASGVTGAVTVTGPATVNADASTNTVTVKAINGADDAENAKAVVVNAAKAKNVQVDTNTSVLTGSVTVNAAAATQVDIDNATGGGTLNAAKAAETTTESAGISIGNIDASGFTVVTGSYAKVSTAIAAEILVEGTANGDDSVTISAGGFLKLNTASDGSGSDQVELVSLSGNGAAVTYEITGGTASQYTITGSQDVTIQDAASALNGKTVVDSTTAGTTTVILDGNVNSAVADLSKVAVDKLRIAADMATSTTNIITVASGSSIEIAFDQTDLHLDSKTTDGTLNVSTGDDTAANGTTIELTVEDLVTTDVKTLTIDATAGKLTGDDLNVGTANTVVVTGSKAVAFDGDYVASGGSAALSGNVAKEINASAATGAITLNVGLTKTVSTGAGDDVLVFDDGVVGTLTGNAATAYAVATGAGDDTVTITSAADTATFDTAAGDDTVTISDDNKYVVVTGSGDDTVKMGVAANAKLLAGDGTSDKLELTANAAYDFSSLTEFAFSGFETLDITATGNAVTVLNGAFNAAAIKVVGDAAADSLVIKGNDTTGSTADTIDASKVTRSGTITLTLDGGTGADIITGSAGAETIIGGAGADTIDGGLGTDTLSVAGLFDASTPFKDTVVSATTDGTAGVVVNLGATAVSEASLFARVAGYLGGTLTEAAAGSANYLYAADKTANASAIDSIANVENVVGSAGRDYIVGTGGDNVITGAGGADFINVGLGTDTVRFASLDDSTKVAKASALSGTITITNAFDVITGLGGGDKLDVSSIYTTDITLGTGLIASTVSAAAASIVRGIYDATAGTWAAGTTDATYNDYMFQVSDGTSITSVLLVDVTILGTSTDASGIFTLVAA